MPFTASTYRYVQFDYEMQQAVSLVIVRCHWLSAEIGKNFYFIYKILRRSLLMTAISQQKHPLQIGDAVIDEAGNKTFITTQAQLK